MNIHEIKKTFKQVFSMNNPIIASFRLVHLIGSLSKRNLIWIYRKSMSKNGEIIKKVQGNYMLLDVGCVGLDLFETNLFKQLAVSDIREPVATDYLLKILKKGDRVVDLGANIGYYVTIESVVLGEEGHIIAIEPDSKNLSILKKNLELNHISNIVDVYPLAISDKIGQINFYVSDRCNWHSTMNLGDEYIKETVEVESRTLDDLVGEQLKIDFIRMDIEGAEVEAIKGMQNTLKRNKNLKLFIELHPHNRKNPIEIVDMLKNLKSLGFQTTKVISFDTHIKRILGLTREENLTIEELINDERIINGNNAFEVFFERKV